MRILLVVLITVLLPATAFGQIYADFTVSQGSTNLGTFRAQLDFEKAPRTCANFIGLATGRRRWVDVSRNLIVEDTPFYDGLIFHRLIHNFVIQGGSSNGLGTAGSGYVIQDEFHPDLRHSGRYLLSMAKTSLPGTGNSQFFITLAAAPNLNDKHSVFGEVIEGKDLIDRFADPALFPTDRTAAGASPGDPAYSDRPVTEIRMDSVVISGPSLDGFDLDDPALELPVLTSVKPVPERTTSSSFTTLFHRKARHDYLYSYSFDLAAWTFLGSSKNILSLNDDPSYDFTVSGVSFDRFFANVGSVDYSFLVNPSPSALAAGTSITFTTRNRELLTLTPNGSGGGSWTDTWGDSGTISNLAVSDAAPETGTFQSSATQAHFIPILNLSFDLSAAGGPAKRTHHTMTLDFREPDAGWTDGKAWSAGELIDGTNFLHAFEITTP